MASYCPMKEILENLEKGPQRLSNQGWCPEECKEQSSRFRFQEDSFIARFRFTVVARSGHICFLVCTWGRATHRGNVPCSCEGKN